MVQGDTERMGGTKRSKGWRIQRDIKDKGYRDTKVWRVQRDLKDGGYREI